MATQTDIDPQIIESLEFSPECMAGDYHSVNPGAPVEWWYQSHDCGDGLICSPCKAEWVKYLLDSLMDSITKTIKCAYCKNRFATVEAFVTFTPLKG